MAILHKANLVVSTKSSDTGLVSFEHCEIGFKTGSKCLKVCVIYRPPPSKKNKLTNTMFFDEFTPFLQDCMSTAGDLIVVGDVNFHLDKPHEAEPKKFLTLLDSLNFQQHVTSPTHRSGHILDVVITKDNQYIIQEVKVGDMLSDHNLIVCKIHHPKPVPLRVTVTTRKLRSVDITRVKSDISEKVVAASDEQSTAALTDRHNQLLSAILENHAPARKKTVTIRRKQPWFSDELYTAKCNKRIAERTWRRTGLTVHKEIYHNSRTCYNNMLDAAKTSYYHDKIVQSGSDMKALGGIMNDILHHNKEVKLPTHSSAEELANNFATFFKEKIDKIRQGLPHIDGSLVFPIPQCTSSWTRFDQVTDEEIHKIIVKSPTKGCSLDPMPTWLVKGATEELIPVVTSIVNSSLSSGCVPESMKVAIINPLIKKPSLDPEVLSNYRPVSNLSFLSKIIEKTVSARLNTYMYQNHLHDPLQSAYKTQHSTETALTKVHNDLLGSIDRHGVAILMILDLSAAFDMMCCHLELGQLWRCPVEWCTVWKGSVKECREHFNDKHGGSATLDFGNVLKSFPPWTVPQELWQMALRPEVSGIAVDARLFHEAGRRLVHKYRVYKDHIQHFVEG